MSEAALEVLERLRQDLTPTFRDEILSLLAQPPRGLSLELNTVDIRFEADSEIVLISDVLNADLALRYSRVDFASWLSNVQFP